jgi:hypothetical protein
MATMKEEYRGGKKGGMLAGLKTRNPPVNDKSRRPIGESHPSVDSGANRSEPSVQPPTIGPRTA